MDDEGYSAHIPRSARSDPRDSRGGFNLNAKLVPRARISKFDSKD